MQIPARIGGRAVSADEWIEVLSPYDGAPVARVPALGADHVAEAVAAAEAALARRDFPRHRRAEVLERAAELLAERTEEFAVTIAREAGKPIRDARGEAARCLATLKYSAVEARKLGGEVIPMDGLAFAMRHPIGVVAAISPFNFPLNLVAHKLGPAIAAGCPVVLKPAELTPLSAIRLVDLLVEAGLPADWISVVTGTGAAAGTPLVQHPGPALVTFTGSVGVGRRIQDAAPRKRVLLELGSNAPVIVEPSADLDRVIAAIRTGGFSYAGQSCISTQRVLVSHEIYDKVLYGLRAAVATLRVGDPLAEETDVGPLISEEAATRVESWLAAARAAGADVTGGLRRGSLVTPAVVADPPHHLDVYRREVFGPVITVTPYADLDEAIALANDSDYGLQAGIFTADIGAALRAANELAFGGVLINQVPTFRADQQPYGGLRDAGNTREGPAYAVQEMTELRFVMVSP
ncbi:aldehyde dehydrogenase family protein [Actinoplanes sp. KI2]|uniref:aldehyde dehydrogenase family protein n=1 Tax=Actinoplanes sp. KI2 TaxID=2983315 RepID=UPI0021D571C6|nr:aldehyde dehydrogenase family protein [Actinoplanes sp. KI2]MCU7729031.1 aldehyde dehydrogenase family protein [Actinoplanes sp. KI2]